MATARKPAARKPAAEATVTVTVVPGFLVYHDGEQRDGKLTGVPAEDAEIWRQRGWVELAD